VISGAELLRAAAPDLQKRIAVQLASLVEPFADLATDRERPSPSLIVLADELRQLADVREVDALRHRLWSTPALQDDDEPEGPGRYALGAVVAWIYAADALCTAPSDGAVNAYGRVEDLLDAVEQDLGVVGLCHQLRAATAEAAQGHTSSFEYLAATMREMSPRLRNGTPH
jgi:hypothetical protein